MKGKSRASLLYSKICMKILEKGKGEKKSKVIRKNKRPK